MAGRFPGCDRRAFLAATALAACGRPRAPRYRGWLFIASEDERGVAVGDIAEFRHVTTIALPRIPQQLLLAGDQVFITCPDAGMICEIDPGSFTLRGSITLPGRIVACAVTRGGASLVAVTDRPAALHVVDTQARRVVRTVALPESPLGMDISEDRAAVTTAGNSVVRISLADGRPAGSTALGLRGGVIRFRPDGKSILTGAAERNQIVTLDAATGEMLTRLPLAFVPRRFCFSADNGGQMFVTGTGEDSIVIVSPYQSEVDETMVAGHKPYGMAVAAVEGRNLLFVTNTGSADLTIFDIDTRELASSVHIGGNPGEVLITPDGAYALVIDRDTGDVSVVRMSVALDRKLGMKEREASLGQGTRPLFTVFPTGAAPQSAVIIPMPA